MNDIKLQIERPGSNEAPQTESTKAPERTDAPRTEGEIGNSMRQALKQRLGDVGRDDAGRFSSTKPAVPGGGAPAVSTTTPPGQVAGQQTQATAPAADPILPPADMNAEEKAAWATLSPEAQRYLSRRSYEYRADYTRKMQTVAERERAAGDLMNAANQYRDHYNQLGIPTHQAAGKALAWDYAIATRGMPAVREFLEAHGYGLDAISEYLQGGGEEQPQAPQALTPEQVQQMVAQQFEQQRHLERAARLAEENDQAVDLFMSEMPLFKDPGTASQIEAAMIPLVEMRRMQINAGRVKPETQSATLKWAYEQALQHDPSVAPLRERLEAKKQAEQATLEAQNARQAAKSIHGGPGSGSPKHKAKNFRDSLRYNLSR